MADKEIHILMGRTGEYDDEVRWSVFASFNKELLEYNKVKCIEEGNRIMNEIHSIKEWTHNYPSLVEEKKIKAHSIDDKFQLIDSIFDYYIITVPMLGVK